MRRRGFCSPARARSPFDRITPVLHFYQGNAGENFGMLLRVKAVCLPSLTDTSAKVCETSSRPALLKHQRNVGKQSRAGKVFDRLQADALFCARPFCARIEHGRTGGRWKEGVRAFFARLQKERERKRRRGDLANERKE